MAGMGNGKHLETGEPRPSPPGNDVLRVYGMKFCPYVHRLKLVLAAKDIPHETVNINLSKKPEWYFDINPLGKVPSIEKNGIILYESDVTSYYVDETYAGKKLATVDPLKKAREQILLGAWGNGISGFYGYLRSKTPEEKDAAETKIRAGFKAVDDYLNNGNQFVCGSGPGFTDYMIWPHLERLALAVPSILKEYALLQAYFDRMGEDKAVKACRHVVDHYNQFIEGYAKGNVVYDIGTVEAY
ncbi:unnamed protein product [Clavelina lepadiformis]|uniref:Glutathione S-transferase omega n=1 Tax=Clavelina lepadiformis TaxID=159417 RepID=A0ABP0FX75_CLALP